MMTVHDCDSKFKLRITLSKYRDAHTPTTIYRMHLIDYDYFHYYNDYYNYYKI